MNTYLIKDGENFHIQMCKGFKPAKAIATVSNDVAKEDYPFLYAELQTIDDVEQWVVLVDGTAKAANEQAVAAQELERAERDMRRIRDSLLSETDYTQISDAPISAELKAEYVTYRQALRDLPENTVDVHNPVYPTKPGSV